MARDEQKSCELAFFKPLNPHKLATMLEQWLPVPPLHPDRP